MIVTDSSNSSIIFEKRFNRLTKSVQVLTGIQKAGYIPGRRINRVVEKIFFDETSSENLISCSKLV